MAAPALHQPAAAPLASHDMARQHRAVRSEVSELRGMIASCPETQRSDRFLQMLSVLVGRLRERLVTHFDLEQADHLSRLRRDRPDLAEAVALFEREHARFVIRAARLAALLRAAAPPPDTVAQTLDWLDDLVRHEAAEEEFVARLRR